MLKPNKLLLLILPLFILFLSFYQKSEITNYHMYSSDPEFAYLFNGLTICNGVTPSHVIGPGTPLQAISAVVMKTVHLFRSTNDSLNIDVMKNPDYYCSAINMTVFILLSISLFISGLIVSFATKRIIDGIFLQLIPFSYWVLLDLNSRIMVESVIILISCLLFAISTLYIYTDKSTSKKWVDKYVILFSILIGLISSLKFVYLPVAIIPFMILKGIKRKISYTVLTIIAFFAFSFPILFHWVAFRDWYIGNFFHSGMYGAGQASIIDVAAFSQNIKMIFTQYKFYGVTFITSSILLVIYFLPHLKFFKKKDLEYNALLGCYIALFVLTFLVAKQFKEYYMTVNFLLIVPVWYFLIRIVTRPLNLNFQRYLLIASTVVIAFFVWNNGPKLVFDYHSIRIEKDKKFNESLRYVEENFNSTIPVLLISDYYGSPFKEYGLFFAMGWTNPKMGEIFALDLRKLYPNIYFYHGWNKTFNQWASLHSYISLLKKYETITLYSGDKIVEEKLSEKLHGLNRQLDTKWEVKKTFENINQTFYEVHYDKNADSIRSYYCDAEKCDMTEIKFINSKNQFFGGSEYQNNDFSKSGNYSVKLSKDQFGFTCSLSEVQFGEKYQIEIWRYRNGNENSALVIQSVNEGEYYSNISKSTIIDGNWEKLTLDFNVPENLNNKDVRIYCWNFDKTNVAYFDDLIIKKQF